MAAIPPQSERAHSILAALAGALVGIVYSFVILLVEDVLYPDDFGFGLLGLLLYVAPPCLLLFASGGVFLARQPAPRRLPTAAGMLLGCILGTQLVIKGIDTGDLGLLYLGFIDMVVAGLVAHWLSGFLSQRPARQKAAVFGGAALIYLLSHFALPAIEAGVSEALRPRIERTALVLIPAGTFLMGSPLTPEVTLAEIPAHEVYLDDFWIEKTEVTIAQYLACAAAGSCTLPNIWERDINGKYSSDRVGAWPATNLSWQDASDYCHSIGRRLPTEAEWEKAARGTDGRLLPWGDRDLECSLSNYIYGCERSMAAVGSFPAGASPYGVLDMVGNVSEWVQDQYDPLSYEQAPLSNPQGSPTGTERVVRGDDRLFDRRGSEAYLYSAIDRYGVEPQKASYRRGFRCASAGAAD